MREQNIILTGFMATGKTTVGKLLARRLGYRFIDTDTLIEEQTGQTVREIFASQGEPAFRALEADLVTQLADEKRLVIATGGGLVLNPDNVKRLRRSGQIFCLTAAAADILHRVRQQGDTRPLLQEADPLQKITTLLRQRDSVYRQFPQLSTAQQTPEQIVDNILSLINN